MRRTERALGGVSEVIGGRGSSRRRDNAKYWNVILLRLEFDLRRQLSLTGQYGATVVPLAISTLFPRLECWGTGTTGVHARKML